MVNESYKPLASNAFRLSIAKDLATFDFAFAKTDEEKLTDDNVEKVASIVMPIGLLEIMKDKIEDALEKFKK